MSSITDDIDQQMQEARDQANLAVGDRLEAELSEQEQATFDKARAALEAEEAVLPEKYRGKTAAEVYQLVQKELEYKAQKAKDGESSEDDQEEAPEEEEDKTPEPEESEATKALAEASEEFYASEGKLKPETIAKLEALDSADLIKAWQELQAKAPAPEAPLSDADAKAIVDSVGGQDSYNKALQWAAENLSDDDKASYDAVIQSGNKAATKFAVEALLNRYKADVGFDGDTVSGGKPKKSGVKPFRSNAEFQRALRDPRYAEDPAYQMDIMERLQVSPDVLPV